MSNQRPERYVNRDEIWNALDEDTQSFVRALTSKTTVMAPESNHPAAKQVEVEVAISIRAIKTTELIYIKDHPKCQSMKKKQTAPESDK